MRTNIDLTQSFIDKLLQGLLLISFIGSVWMLNSCSSIKVISDLDDSVDFQNLKTYQYYGWSNNSEQALNRLDRERIEKAFAEEAAKRGISGVSNGGDMIVTLFVTGQIKTQTTANTTTMGMGGMGGMGMGHRGMRSPGWGWGTAHSTTTYNESQYIEGSLAIEIFDPEAKKLIWTAMGTKKVSEDPQKRAQMVPKTVAEIMKKYPVKPLD